MNPIAKFSQLKKLSFSKPEWDDHVGAAGGYIATSECGKFEAIAEPNGNGWLCWLVDAAIGEDIESCAF